MAAPGAVVLIDVMGAVVQKPRPAGVVSSDVYHATRPDVIVAFLTTNVVAATAPTDYVLQDWAGAGLRYPSAFRAFLSTRPDSEIIHELAQHSDRDWQEVQARLRIALGL
jgi:mRNA interferase MazF